jgi:hypothetical protein
MNNDILIEALRKWHNEMNEQFKVIMAYHTRDNSWLAKDGVTFVCNADELDGAISKNNKGRRAHELMSAISRHLEVVDLYNQLRISGTITKVDGDDLQERANYYNILSAEAACELQQLENETNLEVKHE